MAVRYFLYSREQLNFRRAIEDKMGNVYTPGSVVVGGVKKPFTEISTTPTSKRYSDANVVTSGEIDNIVYIPPSTIRKGR